MRNKVILSENEEIKQWKITITKWRLHLVYELCSFFLHFCFMILFKLCYDEIQLHKAIKQNFHNQNICKHLFFCDHS
jgi:hypothetical protein